MPIRLATLTFDNRFVQAREIHQETGGKDARIIELRGMVHVSESRAAFLAAVDAVLHAASSQGNAVPLSLRPGRRLLVRRLQFERETAEDAATASFRLKLEAEDPFEYSEEEHGAPWHITASGAAIFLEPAGNVDALPAIELIAQDTLRAPAITDNTHALTYPGEVHTGQRFFVDCAEKRVWVDALEVTPHCLGEFPRLVPGNAVLTYFDDPASSHLAEGAVRWRDRWW